MPGAGVDSVAVPSRELGTAAWAGLAAVRESAEGHQFQRPSSIAMEGTNSNGTAATEERGR